MIIRKNRFHGHHSVSKVRGSVTHSTNYSIRTAKNNKKDYRLAVVVSKKVDSRAVIRNRIRRRIFEVFRTQGELEGLPIDVVIYIKDSKVAKIPYADFSDEIIKLLKKAKSSIH